MPVLWSEEMPLAVCLCVGGPASTASCACAWRTRRCHVTYFRPTTTDMAAALRVTRGRFAGWRSSHWSIAEHRPPATWYEGFVYLVWCNFDSVQTDHAKAHNSTNKHGKNTKKSTLSTEWCSTQRTAINRKQEFVRPRWPYDMRPSVRAEKYIRDASGWRKDVTDGSDNGTDGRTDGQTDGRTECDAICGPLLGRRAA